MTLARDVGLYIQPAWPTFPYPEIVQAFLALRYEPAPCRRALADIVARHRLPGHLFDPGAIERGGLCVTDELLHGAYQHTASYVAHRTGPPRSETAILDASELAALGAALRARRDNGLLAPLYAGDARRAWPTLGPVGVQRREHASVAVRGRDAAVLVDPIGLAVGIVPGATPIDCDGAFGAVAITHGHADHWHAPSVVHQAAPLAIVPAVPQTSLMTPEDPAVTLRLLGQNCATPAWGSVVAVGDIEVEVLPFFGEQATREAPGPAATIRNWGNCYRFDVPGLSVLVLVDAGRDPAGDAAAVVADSRARRGPPDLLLASLHEFVTPFTPSCLALPFARQRELFAELAAGRLRSMSAGPRGIVELCAASEARFFLPYADGFSAAGVPERTDWGRGPSEAEVVAAIGRDLAAAGVATRACTWNPGDCVHPDRGELVVVPYS